MFSNFRTGLKCTVARRCLASGPLFRIQWGQQITVCRQAFPSNKLRFVGKHFLPFEAIAGECRHQLCTVIA